MNRPNPDALSVAVGERNMDAALDKIQQAQRLIEGAAEDLSPILGASLQWDRGQRLHRRVRAWWDAVARQRAKLRAKGGPRVDDVKLRAVRAELALAQAAAHE